MIWHVRILMSRLIQWPNVLSVNQVVLETPSMQHAFFEVLYFAVSNVEVQAGLLLLIRAVAEGCHMELFFSVLCIQLNSSRFDARARTVCSVFIYLPFAKWCVHVFPAPTLNLMRLNCTNVSRFSVRAFRRQKKGGRSMWNWPTAILLWTFSSMIARCTVPVWNDKNWARVRTHFIEQSNFQRPLKRV